MKDVDIRHAGRTDKGAERRSEPWDESAAQEVRSVRGAITNRDESDHVPPEVAPMMSEFLARLDGMQAAPPRVHAPPTPPDGSRPPTPGEFARHLRGALDAMTSGETQVGTQGDGPIARMVEEGREFLRLRRDSVTRAQIVGAGDGG